MKIREEGWGESEDKDRQDIWPISHLPTLSWYLPTLCWHLPTRVQHPRYPAYFTPLGRCVASLIFWICDTPQKKRPHFLHFELNNHYFWLSQ
jgi:hypothetical protein